MKEFLNEHLPAIITGILGLGAWIFEKRKKNAELQVAESDAIQAMQASYKTFVSDMNHKYAELKADFQIIKEDNSEMKIQVELLKLEVIEWKGKYQSLRNEMNSMENNVQTTPNNGLQ